MIFLKLSALMGECRDATRKMLPSHVFSSSNPAFVKSGFSPGCLKRLEDALTGRNT
jgi:hypothetical protein